MKLSEWCKNKGVSYGTGLRWYHLGKINNSYQMDTGTIIVDDVCVVREEQHKTQLKELVIYARVSNRDRKEQLQYQVDRLTNFAISNGFIIKNIYKEIASGMNDDRKIFWKMLDNQPKYILVENKDRLTRFGFNYLKVLFNRLGTDIIVINNTDDDKQDLMKDLISIITSFCGRIYGLRRSHKIATSIKNNIM